MPIRIARRLIVLTLPLLTLGCSSGSDDLAWFAQQATEQQAEQNRRMADLQQEVAKGSRELVEADAKARAEFTGLHRDLQVERAELGHQRDVLEDERREIADERITDPIIANALTNIGLLMAGLLPLVLCWQLLRQNETEPADALVAEVLLCDLVAGQPLLLAPPEQKRLPNAASEPDTDGSPRLTAQ